MTGSGTLLLVDDDAAYAGDMAATLRRFTGMNVEIAPDARQALWVLVNHSDIDAIVTDHDMPGIDGYELIRRVRGVLRRRLPIALTTSRRRDKVRPLDGLNVHFFNKREVESIVAWVGGLGSGRKLA
jgi:two-component system chemotaxis sensor kinase CheA